MERSSTASAHDSAAEHVESEMRKARDGQPYTREDFDAWFTTQSQASWDAAEPVTASAAEHGQLERRKAWDGQPYTREGFDAWFATRSRASWDEAEPVTPPNLRPQCPAASSSQLTSSLSPNTMVWDVGDDDDAQADVVGVWECDWTNLPERREVPSRRNRSGESALGASDATAADVSRTASQSLSSSKSSGLGAAADPSAAAEAENLVPRASSSSADGAPRVAGVAPAGMTADGGHQPPQPINETNQWSGCISLEGHEWFSGQQKRFFMHPCRSCVWAHPEDDLIDIVGYTLWRDERDPFPRNAMPRPIGRAPPPPPPPPAHPPP